jgi:2'-5' RNA ligase
MIGIFIEPNKELKAYINKWKKKINKKFIKSKLTSHPPHSTIYYANLIKDKNILKVLEATLKTVNSFKISVNKTLIFYDDALTGGDTMCLLVNKNDKLFQIQKKIAENLKFFIKKNSNSNLKFTNKALSTSVKKYGYPFVGKHWLPHFTISSIINKRNTSEFKQFVEEKVKFTNNINYISAWKITGNKHILIKRFKLKINEKD